MAAMKAAREAGALLSYDPNVREPLWPSAEACREGIKSIWNSADIIKLLLVTDGEKGCRYFTKNFRGAVGGFSVNTVDTTGAGDAFVGSVLCSAAKDSSILEDESRLREALKMANACGAICTTRKGAIPALPDNAAAQKLISDSH
ncbi:fructokinase-2 [Papaver somniferum]|uniref:fructokinase-2 n=1 Tax=Papaver somniferum TaxID=3469 RepID=UPI000E6FF0ED|nr:fructokinase-2 [Papaver somniferum]